MFPELSEKLCKNLKSFVSSMISFTSPSLIPCLATLLVDLCLTPFQVWERKARPELTINKTSVTSVISAEKHYKNRQLTLHSILVTSTSYGTTSSTFIFWNAKIRQTTQVCNTTSVNNTINQMRKWKCTGFPTKVRASSMCKLKHR